MSVKKRNKESQEPIWFISIIILLLIIGIGLAGYALYTESRIEQGERAGGLCSIVENGGCNVVLTSPYARWFGIPLPGLALIFYLGLLSIFVIKIPANLRNGLFTLGVLFSCLLSLYLFYITRAVLKTVCPICYAMYLVHFLLLGFLILRWGSPVRILRNAWNEYALFRWLSGISTLTLIIFVIAGRTSESSTWQEWNPVKETRPVSQASFYYQHLKSLGRVDLKPGMCTPLYGTPDAPLKIWEFSDFQCPWCKRMAGVMELLIQQYGQNLYIEYCHYPLDSRCNARVQKSLHPYACELALLAECAALRGQFRRIHDEIFQNQENIEAWLSGQIPSSIDIGDLRSCISRNEIIGRVEEQITLGQMLNVTATPTVFLNGLRLTEAPVEYFADILKLELESQGSSR